MCRKHSRKKVVATASRREGVYNRTGEPSVPFCEKGEARKRANDFFCIKKIEAKRTLLRRAKERQNGAEVG